MVGRRRAAVSPGLGHNLHARPPRLRDARAKARAMRSPVCRVAPSTTVNSRLRRPVRASMRSSSFASSSAGINCDELAVGGCRMCLPRFPSKTLVRSSVKSERAAQRHPCAGNGSLSHARQSTYIYPAYVRFSPRNGNSRRHRRWSLHDPKETFGSFWQPRLAYSVVGSGATRNLELQTNLDGKFATMRA